jgi:hypothetical protein
MVLAHCLSTLSKLINLEEWGLGTIFFVTLVDSKGERRNAMSRKVDSKLVLELRRLIEE